MLSSHKLILLSPEDPLWDPCLKILSASRELNKCHLIYSAMLRVRGTKAKAYVATRSEHRLRQGIQEIIDVVLLLKNDEQMAVISIHSHVDEVLQNCGLIKEIAETLHREMNSVKSIRVMGELKLVEAINKELSKGFNPPWSVSESEIMHSHELPLTWKPATKDAVRSQEEEGLSYFVLKAESENQSSDSEQEEIEFCHSETESLVSLFWPNHKDTPAVEAICKEFYTDNFLGYKNRVEPSDYRKHAVKMIEEKRLLLCRHIDGSIIASAAIDVLIGGVARLSHIYVHRAFRGRRLGPRLITAACSSIREKDLNCRIFLFVNDTNIAMQRSIYRVGFRPSPATVSYLLQHYTNDNNYRYYKSGKVSIPTPVTTLLPSSSSQYSYTFTDGNKYCPRENDVIPPMAIPNVINKGELHAQTIISDGNIIEVTEGNSDSVNNTDAIHQENNCDGGSEASLSDPEPEAEDVYEDDEIETWNKGRAKRTTTRSRIRWPGLRRTKNRNTQKF